MEINISAGNYPTISRGLLVQANRFRQFANFGYGSFVG